MVILLGAAAAGCLDAPPASTIDPPGGDGSGGGDALGPCSGGPTSGLIDDFLEEDALAAWELKSNDPGCTLTNQTDDIFVENTAPDGECFLRSKIGYQLDEVWLLTDHDHIGTGDPEAEFRLLLGAGRYLAIQHLAGGFSVLDCDGPGACQVLGPAADSEELFWRFRHDGASDQVIVDLSPDLSDWLTFEPLVDLPASAVDCVFLELGSYGDPEGENGELAFEGINVES